MTHLFSGSYYLIGLFTEITSDKDLPCKDSEGGLLVIAEGWMPFMSPNPVAISVKALKGSLAQMC